MNVAKREKKKKRNNFAKLRSAIKVFKKYFPSPLRVLCLGTRIGMEVELFNKKGYNAIGTDIVEEYVEYARSKNRNVIYDDIMHTKLKENSFDVIFGRHFLEHVSSTVKLLRICHKLLKPNGGVFFIFPLESHEGDKTHLVRYPTLDDFKYIADGSNFETLYLGKSKKKGIVPFTTRMGEVLYIAKKVVVK